MNKSLTWIKEVERVSIEKLIETSPHKVDNLSRRELRSLLRKIGKANAFLTNKQELLYRESNNVCRYQKKKPSMSVKTRRFRN